MRRREFISLLGSAAAWPITARAQQRAVPVIGFLGTGLPEPYAQGLAAFRRALSESGFVEGQSVMIEYAWAENQYGRLSALASDLVRRRVTMLVATPTSAALAAKQATATIPIVFGIGDDPVRNNLVTSLNRPGGNATGISYLTNIVTTKRLGILRDVLPKATRVAMLVNPGARVISSAEENALQDARTAAAAVGLAIEPVYAATSRDIDAVFAMLAQNRPDALLVAASPLYQTRRLQLATLAAQYRIPMMHYDRQFAEVGGLMTYGTSIADEYRQLGLYTGRVLKGAKPADLPVLQPTKLEFVINLLTARALGLEIPPGVLATADEVIE
jgi:putative tryptophan/tyrosine transport system substrate-binding protein